MYIERINTGKMAKAKIIIFSDMVVIFLCKGTEKKSICLLGDFFSSNGYEETCVPLATEQPVTSMNIKQVCKKIKVAQKKIIVGVLFFWIEFCIFVEIKFIKIILLSLNN